MATRHLLNLTRRRSRITPFTVLPPCITFSSRSSTSITNPSQSSSLPSPPPPDAMIYDRLAEQVKSKIKRLEDPNQRFLRYNSPDPTVADHTSILSAPETKVTTLPNGLRIATESNLSSQTATVGVWIDAGSRFETEENNGVAHFLEHMIFKGTEKRPIRALEEEIENMGGHLNAYTSREQTTYFAKVLGCDVPKAVDILGDILQNSLLEEDKIIRERSVILREMEELEERKSSYSSHRVTYKTRRAQKSIPNIYAMVPYFDKVEQQPEEVIFDQLHTTAFQYTPLGRTILGPAQNIEKMTRAHIQDYISTHYGAHRMVISAAGAVKHEEVVELVKKHFTKLSSNPITTSQLVSEEPAIFTGSEIRIIDDDLPLAQFAVAFSGASWTDPDSIALMVMQQMLGSWNKSSGGGKHMGSELVQRVAINELAESVMAFNTNYKDTGLFGVYAEAKPDCLSDLAYVIMNGICKLSYKVSDADVVRARNQLKSSLMLHIDGSGPTAEDIGRQLITYGRRIPYAELFSRIDSVDAGTIKRVANRFIFDRDVAISARGPIQDLPDYNWFRRRTYWLRY